MPISIIGIHHIGGFNMKNRFLRALLPSVGLFCIWTYQLIDKISFDTSIICTTIIISARFIISPLPQDNNKGTK